MDKTSLKPNEAVDNWAKDMSEGRVASLWDSLPSSYQADATGVVHSLGEKVDAEVYDEAMKTLKAATSMLKNKKSLILELANEKVPKSEKGKLDKVAEKYDVIVALIDSIASSDAKDVDGLKKLDLAKFFGDIQKHIMELSSLADLADDEIMENIKKMTVTLVSESGDTAEVEVTVGDDKDKRKLVKKDDRWIPEDLVKKWPEMMKEAKGGLGEMADMNSEMKQQVLTGIGMVQKAIEQLESAKSKEEMMEKAGGLMKMMGGM